MRKHKKGQEVVNGEPDVISLAKSSIQQDLSRILQDNMGNTLTEALTIGIIAIVLRSVVGNIDALEQEFNKKLEEQKKDANIRPT